MITIVLADDHAVVRRGIKMLLEEERDFRVVGEASDNMEAVRLVEALRPDVLVTDLSMHGLTGFDVIKIALRLLP